MGKENVRGRIETGSKEVGKAARAPSAAKDREFARKKREQKEEQADRDFQELREEIDTANSMIDSGFDRDLGLEKLKDIARELDTALKFEIDFDDPEWLEIKKSGDGIRLYIEETTGRNIIIYIRPDFTYKMRVKTKALDEEYTEDDNFIYDSRTGQTKGFDSDEDNDKELFPEY